MWGPHSSLSLICPLYRLAYKSNWKEMSKVCPKLWFFKTYQIRRIKPKTQKYEEKSLFYKVDCWPSYKSNWKNFVQILSKISRALQLNKYSLLCGQNVLAFFKTVDRIDSLSVTNVLVWQMIGLVQRYQLCLNLRAEYKFVYELKIAFLKNWWNISRNTFALGNKTGDKKSS